MARLDDTTLRRFEEATGLSRDDVGKHFTAIAKAVKAGKLTEVDFIQAIREWGRINRVANDNACVGGSNACV